MSGRRVEILQGKCGTALQSCPFMGKGPSLCLSSLPSASLSPAPLSAGENLKRDPISLENIYSPFQPSLENVDPTTEATRGPIPS